MTSSATHRITFDGGSRGNPGPAAGAGVLWIGRREIGSRGVYLGERTNNQAEYAGLIAGLGLALEHGAPGLIVEGDSKLVIQQIRGKWACNSDRLAPLLGQAALLLEQFPGVLCRHIPREWNDRADAIVNEVLDAEALTRSS